MKTTAKRATSKIALPFFMVFSACQTVQNSALPNLTTSKKMAWLTYAIATNKRLGTCVVVKCKDVTAPSGTVPVLATCGHVKPEREER